MSFFVLFVVSCFPVADLPRLMGKLIYLIFRFALQWFGGGGRKRPSGAFLLVFLRFAIDSRKKSLCVMHRVCVGNLQSPTSPMISARMLLFEVEV